MARMKIHKKASTVLGIKKTVCGRRISSTTKTSSEEDAITCTSCKKP